LITHPNSAKTGEIMSEDEDDVGTEGLQGDPLHKTFVKLVWYIQTADELMLSAKEDFKLELIRYMQFLAKCKTKQQILQLITATLFRRIVTLVIMVMAVVDLLLDVYTSKIMDYNILFAWYIPFTRKLYEIDFVNKTFNVSVIIIFMFSRKFLRGRKLRVGHVRIDRVNGIYNHKFHSNHLVSSTIWPSHL